MATPARARETFVALRHAIAKIEGRLPERLDAPSAGNAAFGEATHLAGGFRQPTLPTGVQRFDAALGGGLPLAGLIELHASAARDGAAAAGLALAFSRLAMEQAKRVGAPLLWIATSEMIAEVGRPYAPGLAARFGVDPEALILAEAAKAADVLWIAEEAANAGVFSGVLVELRGAPGVLDLTATRRLHRRALLAGHPMFLLRNAGREQPTAAPLRLVAQPASAAPRHVLSGPLAGSIGPPVFSIAIAKSRAAPTDAIFTLEWTKNVFREQTTHSLDLVSAPARRASPAPTSRTILAFPPSGRTGAAGLQPAREQHATRRGA